MKPRAKKLVNGSDGYDGESKKLTHQKLSKNKNP